MAAKGAKKVLSAVEKKAAAKRNGAKRLTLAQIDQIIGLQLKRTPVKEIASQLSVSTATVQKHWNDWLDETQTARREQLERSRSEQIAHLERLARQAYHGAANVRLTETRLSPSERALAESRYLREERQSIRELCRIAGFEAPIQVAASFVPPMTETEAVEQLKMLADK